MGKPVRWILNHVAGRLGYNVSRRVHEGSVARVMSYLRPIDAGVPLIRIGADRDGGYLIPDDLKGIHACLSPGVAASATFELDLERRGITSLLADASVEQPPEGSRHMTFDRKFIGIETKSDTVTLDQWMSDRLPSDAGDLILQMDIEGAEWPVLANVSDHGLRRFRIIVIEFHGLESITEPFAWRVMNDVLGRLASRFVCVHLHPNNNERVVRVGKISIPTCMEATFLRRDRVRTISSRTDFPHAHDRDNVSNKRPIVLPKCWYQ
jgi:hypothetical protein